MFRLFAKPAAPTTDTALVDSLIAFVRGTGLEVREASLKGKKTFLPGLLLERGGLVLDRRHLLYPGDILHEAGHLAVTPAAERATVGGNITEQHPEKEGEEMAVLAWTFAAAVELGLPLEVLFHDEGYKGQSQWLRQCFSRGQYIGLPLLAWMGLTTVEEFPRMTRWLRA